MPTEGNFFFAEFILLQSVWCKFKLKLILWSQYLIAYQNVYLYSMLVYKLVKKQLLFLYSLFHNIKLKDIKYLLMQFCVHVHIVTAIPSKISASEV